MERQAEAEYLVLRQAIATRGALRHILALAGVGIWAAVLIAVLVLLPYPVAASIPLLVLGTTFEVIKPLHFGAERIGRYLEVFYEEAGQPDRALGQTPSWERVAMRFGSVPGVGGHPLFVPAFFVATVINYLAVLLPAPVTTELAIMAVPHLAFAVWLATGDRAMRRQRAVDVAQMRDLRNHSR
ncbi:MAG TPA: hypothetical protein VEA16_12530 [Vicinamibacterales bacterium]|nr:hypothetical protein [Vicinamibacterales bacterium]